ncbi:hypothetical protein JW977_05040 [Candidatus Falkowbacteria bacterium]|nr:hypothetical protein [Candidatus Falkowbacteria bacterium]
MFLVKNLQNLGLTDKEAKVYASLSEIKEATPQQLAIRAGINRATSYVILENLLKRGLVKSAMKQKKLHYIIESPTQIINLLEKQKREIEDRINQAKVILPELDMLEKLTSQRTDVKFFEGHKVAQLIQKEIASSKPDRIDEMYNLNIALEYFPIAYNDHRKALNRKKIKTRSLIVFDSKQPILRSPQLWHEEKRYLPSDKFPLYAEIVFFNNKVLIVSLKEDLIGLIIGNKAIVNGFKLMFELAWQGAEPYKLESEIKK